MFTVVTELPRPIKSVSKLGLSTFRVLLGGPQQVHVTDPKADCQFVDCNDRRIAVAALKAAEILLTETRNFCKLLLRQTLFPSHPPDVLPTSLRISMRNPPRAQFPR